MILYDTVKSIQRKERDALNLAGRYAEEKDPVKKRNLRLRMENTIEGMLAMTFIYTQKSKREADEQSVGHIVDRVQKAYYPEDFHTVGDVINPELISTKFRNLEAPNTKPYEESIIGSGAIPQCV